MGPICQAVVVWVEREGEGEGYDAEQLARDRVEEEVVKLAAQSPDAVAKIIKGWMEEDK